jgi:hypothetical protein
MGGGAGAPDTPGHTIPLAGEDPEPPPVEDPCANPVSRKVWNADARAVAAIADLLGRATSLGDGSNLSNREFGANLYLDANGVVDLTTVSVGGTPATGDIPEVTIEPGGTTYLNWMGDIHNHPSGDGRLSHAEQLRFDSRISAIQNMHPDRVEAPWIAAYVVVVDATSPTGYRIYAHTAGSGPDDPGQEVNPNAQPCTS